MAKSKCQRHLPGTPQVPHDWALMKRDGQLSRLCQQCGRVEHSIGAGAALTIAPPDPANGKLLYSVRNNERDQGSLLASSNDIRALLEHGVAAPSVGMNWWPCTADGEPPPDYKPNPNKARVRNPGQCNPSSIAPAIWDGAGLNLNALQAEQAVRAFKNKTRPAESPPAAQPLTVTRRNHAVQLGWDDIVDDHSNVDVAAFQQFVLRYAAASASMPASVVSGASGAATPSQQARPQQNVPESQPARLPYDPQNPREIELDD